MDRHTLIPAWLDDSNHDSSTESFFTPVYGEYQAFSYGTKTRMYQRAGGMSELSNNYKRPLEAAHLNHDKNDSLYDDDKNGLMVTDIEHLAHHLLFSDRPHMIGLSFRHNDFAIQSLKTRVMQEDERVGETVPLEDRLANAINKWKGFYGMVEA